MSADPSVDLVAEVLTLHRADADFLRAPGKWAPYCRCIGALDGLWTTHAEAWDVAVGHVAERVVEALEHGAPATRGEMAR